MKLFVAHKRTRTNILNKDHVAATELPHILSQNTNMFGAATAKSLCQTLCISKQELSSSLAEMGDRGHNTHGSNGGCYSPFAGELGPRLTQCGLGRGLLPYKVPSSSIQPFTHNRHAPKTEGLCPFQGGTAPPSNTTSITSVPSGILIHPAVLPQ